MAKYILALDQGTTSSRAIVFDHDGCVVSVAQQELTQHLPAPGVVEHDPQEIWTSQLAVACDALQQAKVSATNIAAVGITNQRETTILWDRQTGKPVAPAVVWQSRVSAPICEALKQAGVEPTIRAKTGLVLDPYFSASKIKYLLDRDRGLRSRAERGEVLFGTVDTWLIWQLTGGRTHATDVSNASRTMLLDIHRLDWDDELLRVFGVPRAMLPQVRSSSETIATTQADLFGAPIPLAGVAGDQQAATFGQTCFAAGQAKNTYGTGCFLMMNTGPQAIASKHQLLTTVGWKLGGQVTYCLEGAVFIAGAVVQWLRDGLGIIKASSEIEALAATVADNGGIYFVPALVGLGAPYWDPYARGTILGIERGTQAGHIARAAVESMAYQTRDLVEAMQRDCGKRLTDLRVDGGACLNDALMQFQADMLDAVVERPAVAETTAWGAACLAGLAVGFWSSADELAKKRRVDRKFEPQMKAADRDAKYARWCEAVKRARDWAR